jgi:hypothetical protein
MSVNPQQQRVKRIVHGECAAGQVRALCSILTCAEYVIKRELQSARAVRCPLTNIAGLLHTCQFVLQTEDLGLVATGWANLSMSNLDLKNSNLAI